MNFATKNQMNNCSIPKMHRQLKIMPILDKAPSHDIPLPFFADHVVSMIPNYILESST